jgi:signal transduction histidine kinase
MQLKHLAILLLLYCRAAAQHPPAANYTIREGLPTNNVYSICEDARGYLWFATSNGVAKFDGVKFYNYNTNDGLPDNEVFKIFPDKTGALWFISYSGQLCRYQNDRFTTVTLSNSSGAYNNTQRSYPARNGSVFLWHKYSSDFYYLPDITRLPIRLNLWPNKRYTDFRHILQRADGSLQLCFADYDIIYTGNPGNQYDSVSHKRIYDINTDNTDIYYRTQDSIMVYNAQADVLTGIDWKENGQYNILDCYYDRAAKLLLIGTTRGLFMKRLQAPAVLVYPDVSVSKIVKDRAGYYWFSTLDKGVFKLGSQFYNVLYYQLTDGGKPHAVFALQQRIYVAQHNQVAAYALAQQRIVPVGAFLHTGMRQQAGTYRFTALGDTVYYLLNNYACRLPSAGNKNLLAFHFPFKEPLKAAVVLNNQLLARSMQRLFVYNSKLQVQRVLYHKEEGRIFAHCITGNRVLLACADGLYAADTTLQHPLQKISDSIYISLTAAGNEVIAITAKNRLTMIGYANNNIVAHDVPATSHLLCSSVHPLAPGRFVISTGRGCFLLEQAASGYQLSKISETVIPYQHENLFAGDTYCYYTAGNTLYAVPVAQLADTARNSLYIGTVHYNKRTLYFPADTLLQLPYGSDLLLQAAYRSYNNQLVQYEYRINEGVWQRVAGPDISFYNASFGDYRVEIRCRDESNRYAGPVRFRFSVARPWWLQTGWLLLAGLLLLALLLLGLRFLLRRSHRRRELVFEREKRLMQSEFKALNALMNPHFVFNCMNNIQNLLHKQENETASRYLHTFSQIMRQNLKNINLPLITLEQELNLVRNYLLLEQLRFREKLQYSINIDENADTDAVKIPPLLVQPLVENAVKHGIMPLAGDGQIQVHVYEQGDAVVIDIADNGVGYPPHTAATESAQHLSMSIGNIRQRIERANQLYRIAITLTLTTPEQYGFGTGTLVRLSIMQPPAV